MQKVGTGMRSVSAGQRPEAHDQEVGCNSLAIGGPIR